LVAHREGGTKDCVPGTPDGGEWEGEEVLVPNGGDGEVKGGSWGTDERAARGIEKRRGKQEGGRKWEMKRVQAGMGQQKK
jgi:hypothetical protein